MLADAAQEVGGKLYVLGGGWSVTGPMPTSSAVAMLFLVPWDKSDVKHKIKLELVDSDGQPFQDEQGNALAIEGDVETGRPPGLKRGTPLDVAMAVTIPPLPLKPDSRYVWQLTVNGESKEEWRLGFTTRPAMPGIPGLPGQ